MRAQSPKPQFGPLAPSGIIIRSARHCKDAGLAISSLLIEIETTFAAWVCAGSPTQLVGLQLRPSYIGEHLSGLERLRIDFQKKNTLEAVVRTVRYLLSGPGDAIERAYDCIFGSYKLNGFGEACVMELLGWGDTQRPPFNNRSIRGIRLLGFDVEHVVAGE